MISKSDVPIQKGSRVVEWRCFQGGFLNGCNRGLEEALGCSLGPFHSQELVPVSVSGLSARTLVRSFCIDAVHRAGMRCEFTLGAILYTIKLLFISTF